MPQQARDERGFVCANSATGDSVVVFLRVVQKASGRRNRIGIFDVSRACFFTRHANVPQSLIPDEDWKVGDEHRVGCLKPSLHGTRDGAQNGAAANTKYMLSPGFEQDRA